MTQESRLGREESGSDSASRETGLSTATSFSLHQGASPVAQRAPLLAEGYEFPPVTGRLGLEDRYDLVTDLSAVFTGLFPEVR